MPHGMKRKSTYFKSRLPTFGSLTTGKPTSNIAMGSYRNREHKSSKFGVVGATGHMFPGAT